MNVVSHSTIGQTRPAHEQEEDPEPRPVTVAGCQSSPPKPKPKPSNHIKQALTEEDHERRGPAEPHRSGVCLCSWDGWIN